jgi:hypothetical protein
VKILAGLYLICRWLEIEDKDNATYLHKTNMSGRIPAQAELLAVYKAKDDIIGTLKSGGSQLHETHLFFNSKTMANESMN